MITDDPRTPLLGEPIRRSRVRRATEGYCSLDSWKRRLPITIWLPKYKWSYLARDAIAGITVGLTSIPQGIAYALVAGLPPQVGLYSTIFPGLVYMLFGSVKDITVGPTAILAALLAKYVSYSVDFAYLATFLTGCIILLLGVLQLGFLLDFISKQVISAFTTAAALQIAAAQIKSLCRLSGSSGGTFIAAVINLFKNITTIHLWDTVLGVITIITLLLLKSVRLPAEWRVSTYVVRYTVRARNAFVVFAATMLAYLLHVYQIRPFALTGTIVGGLPSFGPPPFSTRVGNETLRFTDMLDMFGPEAAVMPLVAILETIAIAKAFAGSACVDATQEMIAIGACNVLASFCQSMPATGSFTRTAINHASGVVTPAGSLFKASLVLLAVTLLTDAFYFIPRATLAGVIMVAMMSLIDVDIVRKLWNNSKLEWCVYCVTLVAGAAAGLEYGIACGAGADLLRLAARQAGPRLPAHTVKVDSEECVCIVLVGSLSHVAARRVGESIRSQAGPGEILVIDGGYIHSLDFAVAEYLASVLLELESGGCKVLMWNWPEGPRRVMATLRPDLTDKFVTGLTLDTHIPRLRINTP